MMKRFYTRKIGGHLQELGILALVFIPLDAQLHGLKLVAALVISGLTIVVGMEMERRAE